MAAPTPGDLPALLAAVRSLPDLGRLVEQAGYTPDLIWLPAEGWVDTHHPSRAAVIGRRRGFEWLAFETSGDAADLARRIARRLERGARLAGVMALAGGDRRLAVSVSLPPRPLLVADLEDPAPLVLTGLARLWNPEQTSTLGIASDVARALDVEATGRRFFAAFRRSLRAGTALLPAGMPPADRHAAVLLQLTRVLFLYFVQAKGWLDGRPAFLREELDRVLSRGGDPHRHLLHPLFFGTLNQPQGRRGRLARGYGRVPFLNGGLFQPHPLERRWRLALPSSFWQTAFDDLFERFHFTPWEGRGDRVAPDMLGQVFEGVMDPDERHASGTFYTPAALVRELVQATLAAHLAGRLRCSEAEAARRLEEPDQAARTILDSITLLDPACGSGAFLLGALELLSRGRGGSPLRSRQQVLERNLYGVDLNPAAVRLTELRLWLALISSDTALDPAEVAPLPNLDSLVRQGDSLLEPLERGWGGTLPEASAVALGTLRRQLLVATGPAKGAALTRLLHAERDAADAMLSSAEAAVQYQIRDLLAQGRSGTLFGTRAGLGRPQLRRLGALRRQRQFLWSLRRRLSREGGLPWFHYQSQFSEVFTRRGGFDLVVGNPPWVRYEALPASTRASLEARYPWYATPTRGPYAHRPDLAIAFLERAIELTGQGGTVGFLVPAKLATAAYAATARGALAGETRIHCANDLSRDCRPAFRAAAYPFALVVSRAKADPAHRVRTVLEPATPGHIPQGELRTGPWVLAEAGVRRAQQRLTDGVPALGDRFRIHLGVKTGLNEVFLDPPTPLEPGLLRWAVRGRDVRPFGVRPSRRLLWTHAGTGQPLPALPPRATAYLARHRDRLQGRRDFVGGPWWTLFRTGPASAAYRVVWADLSRRLEACALANPETTGLIPLNTCYLLPTEGRDTALGLVAWLNSTWVRALAAMVADPAAGGFRRFSAAVIGRLPLPGSVLEDRELVTLAMAGQAGRLEQAALDEACARHLPLTPDDRNALTLLVPPARAGRR